MARRIQRPPPDSPTIDASDVDEVRLDKGLAEVGIVSDDDGETSRLDRKETKAAAYAARAYASIAHHRLRHCGDCAAPFDGSQPTCPLCGAARPPFPCTDLGNAERLRFHHGEDVRHVAGLGWIAWDGQRWQRDDDGEIERRAKRTVRAILVEASELEEPEEAHAVAGWAMKSEAAARIASMVQLARSEEALVASVADLDADAWALNVANGTLDLRTGELRPHRRADMITKLAPVAYDAAATCPTFDHFISRVMGGDAELVGYVQRVIGYALTGSVREHVILLFYGTGANGKSTLLVVLLDVLGDYGRQAAPTLLLTTRSTDRHPTEQADLLGARLVAIQEVAKDRGLDEATAKQLSGGDRIKARRLYSDFIEFAPTHKLFLGVNHLPDTGDATEGLWRRIRVVPFDVTIPEGERDPTLLEKLRAELPGILAWAVRGCLEWQRRGLDAPTRVREATAGYRDDQDDLAEFWARCDFGPEHLAKANELYANYKHWLIATSEDDEASPLSPKEFGKSLRERGCLPHRGTKGLRYWRGVRLTHPFDDERDDGEPWVTSPAILPSPTQVREATEGNGATRQGDTSSPESFLNRHSREEFSENRVLPSPAVTHGNVLSLRRRSEVIAARGRRT